MKKKIEKWREFILLVPVSMPLPSSMLKKWKIHFGFTQGGDSIVFQLSLL